MKMLSSQRGMRTLASGTLLLGLLFLTGCGFQLRGAGVDNVKLDSLQVSAEDPHSAIVREVVDTLTREQVNISSAAAYQLHISAERQESKAITYSGRATPAEMSLTSQIEYVISDRQERVLVGPETLSTERVYVNDRDNVVGSGQEAELLRREMRRDLSRQLLFRLSSLSESELRAREQALGQPQ
ncbi:LPS-assembly lipoprotein LptE [Halopseudomonas salegens]|uniref:LPS-assembly lipoprotein LptE n=1 Tax=Halopseudomonas salegens TaxID=1434072 RepID=A0A1H2GFG6_9GAMM|nr:LPS assembly lipoprotein LptE [Halopseudomonas salegens]SDU18486.1 LPS-assembly lipoprotein [Halopseudomonas salegens]